MTNARTCCDWPNPDDVEAAVSSEDIVGVEPFWNDGVVGGREFLGDDSLLTVLAVDD